MAERDATEDWIWPPEAKDLAEAKAIWERKGFTRAFAMMAEQIEAVSPGYLARRAALREKK